MKLLVDKAMELSSTDVEQLLINVHL